MLFSKSSEAANARNGGIQNASGSGGPMRAVLIRRQKWVQAGWGEVQEFLDRLSNGLAQGGYSVCVVSDRAMRRYNREFRQQDEPTDVLSFAAGKRMPAGSLQPRDLGDVIISADTAQRNARRYGLRLEDEIKLLALHGVLHLLGHDHQTDHGEMARRERQWAARLGLPQSLIRRASQPGQQGEPAARRYKAAGGIE